LDFYRLSTKLMKNYNTIYYLLFVLLIMGGFASMAQNSYGLYILGGTAIGFALLFLYQALTILMKKASADIFQIIELSSLFVISSVFALRVFYIYFVYIEIIFGLAAFILVLIYGRKMIRSFSEFRSDNSLFSGIIFIFYFSLVLYLLSLATVPLSPRISEITGVSAFICLSIFVIASLMKNKVLINGEKMSTVKIIVKRRDNSILLICLFFLFTLYTSFTRFGLIPKLYSDEYPQAYFEMVRQAESGKELPVNGKYKYQQFKNNYDSYHELHAAKEKPSR
jgi:hypothetical protein